MIRLLFPIAILMLLVSCRDNEETVDFDDLAPVSKRNYDSIPQVSPIDSSVYKRPEKSAFLRIVDTISPEASWQKWDTTLFADRFGPVSTEKWIVITPTDSLTLVYYTFKDSLKTKNAFFNYLDCFGPKCKHFAIGDNVKIPRRNGLFLIGQKQFVALESNKPINEKAIRATYFKKPEEENWIYFVNFPKGGKTVWKRIDKGIETPVKKAYENT